ncbi:hypothetical protein [Cellulosimicrobium sp. Marseille-Q4280]|uniref:hypothetical protein n=1 Tax=Cellulosimicrobium sp. Marseille-Q4280 TaxID=2937992 RepID=UPI00203E2CC1|nr:hypothetical protein [Cellulosimicrobium sp. Marseille-Q4280]
MTGAVIAALVCLALLDGAFSGFRASLGRTGLVEHAEESRRGLLRGAVLMALLAAPAIASMLTDVVLGAATMATYRAAGLAAMAVLGPYALIVLLALGVYGALRWELKYLASALVLGPFTLIRPAVVLAAAIVAIVRTHEIAATVSITLAAAAVVLVEPILNRRHERRSRAAGRLSGSWKRLQRRQSHAPVAQAVGRPRGAADKVS